MTTIFENLSSRKKTLGLILALILFLNTALYFYGLGIYSAELSNPFLSPLVFISFFIIHLPIVYDLYKIIRKEPLNLLGSYFVMFSLWVSLITALTVTVIFTLINFVYLSGISFVLLISLWAIIGVVFEARGLPLIYLFQVFFWFFIARKFILPEIQTDQKVKGFKYILHPDLRDKKLSIIGLVIISLVYLFCGFILSFAFTGWLVPPNSTLWDWWMIN